MTRVTLGKSRVRESRLPGSVRAKAKWLSYSTTIGSFADYYLHGAAPSRSINPDPRDFIRKKADDARDIAATLRQPVGFVALSMAAKRLAKHCLAVGDVKMHGELVALANSLVARAA